MTISVVEFKQKLGEALNALKQYSEKLSMEDQTKDLLPEDTSDSVTLSFQLNQIPQKKQFRYQYLRLPNPLYKLEDKTSSLSICLICRDPKDKRIEELEKAELSSMIAKVVSIKSLKKKYSSHEARRDLCNKFDLFLVEQQVEEMLPNLLGKYFYDVKKSKIPFAVSCLTKDEISKVVESTRYKLSSGPCMGVRVGRLSSQSVEQLCENALVVLKSVEQYLGKPTVKNGIQTVSVQVTNSIGLPVYINARKPAIEPDANVKKNKKRTNNDVDSEATKKQKTESSVPVEVAPDLSKMSLGAIRKLQDKKKTVKKTSKK